MKTLEQTLREISPVEFNDVSDIINNFENYSVKSSKLLSDKTNRDGFRTIKIEVFLDTTCPGMNQGYIFEITDFYSKEIGNFELERED